LATLAALNERSPRRITSLAEDSRSDLSVLSRQIAALENSGLVTRTRDPNDGRAYLVSLTDQGHQMLAEVWAKRVAELRGNLADFSDEDLAHVVLILERIAASWDGRPKTPTNPLPSLRPTT
jgi:DNA-binding MarR family transcriptional regulator